jgi:hypothetical protein
MCDPAITIRDIEQAPDPSTTNNSFMHTRINTIDHVQQDKLRNLVSYLYEIEAGFETIAEEIECVNLKTALEALSVESKQYAEEICDQLKSLNIQIPFIHSTGIWDKIESEIQSEASFTQGGEIVALCNNCENYFKQLYEDVLKEYLPIKNFKDIITYQLFATQCAFMKIRLLNSLRFRKRNLAVN